MQKNSVFYTRVMTVKIYKDLLRLKASDKTGQRHISVKRNVYESYPQHWHDYFEIEVVTQGTGTHYYNGTPYTLEKGDVYLLTPVDFHEIKADTPIEIINISFDNVWLSEEMRSFLYASNFRKMRRTEEKEYLQYVAAAELLRQECEEDGPCIRQLLEYLLSRFIPLNQYRTSLEVNKDYMNGIMKAVEYIEQHFRERITLEMLSQISGYHPTYFSKMFCKVTGENYIDRLTSLRINYAKMLLKKGVAVSEACFASGFGSLSNFVAVFKKKCKMSPSAYRNSKMDRI